MYICPVCGRGFQEEEIVTKHFLNCWKEEHPYHQSKDAPRSENITTHSINNEVAEFFNSFKR